MPNDLFLVDTSIWLEVLPPGRGTPDLRERIDGLLATDRVATTGMIRLELLGGTHTTAEWERLVGHLAALHNLPVTEEHWEEAARLGFQLRRQGITIPSTDLLIGSVALKSGATLLHKDCHFDQIATHVAIPVESYVPPLTSNPS